jgi:hypothetical protein
MRTRSQGGEAMRSGKAILWSRRGTVAALTAVSIPMLFGFVALSVDVGMLYNVKAEIQRAADAGALAGGWALLDEKRLKSTPDMQAVMNAARSSASRFAGLNDIQHRFPAIDLNTANGASGDVVIGQLTDPRNLSEPINFNNPAEFNTIMVRVHRDAVRNGPIDLWFARMWGINSAGLQATAAATLRDGVVGYQVNEKTGNADILPFAVNITYWNQLLSGVTTTGDLYAYNAKTKTVSTGQDGVLEMNMYPGSGGGQLPSGNFGTVDIGNPNNSTSDISRQIRTGISASDLAYLGGQLKLGADGSLNLQGDTGLSAGVKDDLESIIGKPRAIPLFDTVHGPGNNAVFHVIGFAGIRILKVKLTGNPKYVTIQPAMVVDDSALTGGANSSKYVYQPVRLTR